MDWPELRLQLTLRLHQAWPFRVLSCWLERRVPQERGFGQFRPHADDFEPLTPAQHAVLEAHTPQARGAVVDDIATNLETNMNPTEVQLAHARAFIADAERTENSMLTRIDAAINAAFALDPITAKHDPAIGMYAHLKYMRMLTEAELKSYYGTALGLAKTLLSKLEAK